MWNCLSETYCNSTVATDNENLRILDYNVVPPDHLADTNRGGICLYYKTCFSFRVLDIQCLNECINFELKIGNKLFPYVNLYRSSNQSQDNFEMYIDNVMFNLETFSRKNPYPFVVIGGLTQNQRLGTAMIILLLKERY